MRRSIRCLTAVLAFLLTGCGGPWDEEWEGEQEDCDNNTSNDVKLILEGPVTASPEGQWRILTGSGWIETDIEDASYIGPVLTFKAEFRFTFLGVTAVSTTEVELTRSPGRLRGTSTTEEGSRTIECEVSLEPDR